MVWQFTYGFAKILNPWSLKSNYDHLFIIIWSDWSSTLSSSSSSSSSTLSSYHHLDITIGISIRSPSGSCSNIFLGMWKMLIDEPQKLNKNPQDYHVTLSCLRLTLTILYMTFSCVCNVFTLTWEAFLSNRDKKKEKLFRCLNPCKLMLESSMEIMHFFQC